MATHVGAVFQDQNLNVHYNGASVGGKTNASKVLKKGGLGGRKPLSELSNSANPSAYLAPKKHSSMNFTFINEDISASKSTHSVGRKKSLCKAQEKVQTGSRRPLGDISNSGKPCMHQALKENHRYNLNALVEEQLHPSAIANEQFLHNHDECIKAQRKDVDIDYFLKTIGLHNDSSLQLASPLAIPISRKSKPESPLRYMELDEMAELLAEDRSPPQSPPHCRTPKSPNLYTDWKDYSYLDFNVSC